MNWRTSATTWLERLLRESYIVSTMPVVELTERVAQTERAVALLTDLKLKTRQVECRRRDGKSRNGSRQHSVAHRRCARENIVGRCPARFALDAQTGRCIALRVEVDDQHMLPDRSERRAEIDCGRGLADAALLIGDGQRPRADGLRANGRLAERDDLRFGRLIGCRIGHVAFHRFLAVLAIPSKSPFKSMA